MKLLVKKGSTSVLACIFIHKILMPCVKHTCSKPSAYIFF